MNKNRKVDSVPVDKSKKYLWAFLKEKVLFKSKNPIFSLFTPFRMSLAGAMSLILIVAIVLNQNFSFFDILDNSENTAFASFTMEAEKSDSLGVMSDSKFILKSDTDLPADTIAENLEVFPETKISVEKVSEGEYLVSPVKSLEPNSVYNFKIASAIENFSFSYQTRNEFTVMSTIPGNQMSGIPLESGIEIKFSSENFDLETAKNFFEISPSTVGKFEKHGKTLVFVAKGGLAPSTIYTVTVKKGLPVKGSELTLSEEKVFEFETRDSETSNYNNIYFSADNYELKTGIDLAVGVYGAHDEAVSSKIEIFKYENSEDFLKVFKIINDIPNWSYSYKNAYRTDTKNLLSLGEYEAKIDKINYSNFLYVPDLKLEKGFYLMEIKDEKKFQALLQVSDLAVYSNVSLSDTLFWTINLKEGKPSENTKIKYLDTGKEGQTDANGVYKFATPEDFKADYADAKTKYFHAEDLSGNEIFLALKPSSSNYKYYEYNVLASFDKSMYLPNDKMNIWGFIEKKSGENIRRLKVDVRFNYETIADSFEINVEDGFFKSEYLLKNAPIGSYNVDFYNGDDIVASKYFEVTNYVKPAYEIVVDSDRKNYFAGEDINLSVSARYFDGTPVSYGEVEFTKDYREESKKIALDELGKAKITLKAEKNSLDENSKYFSIKDNNYFEFFSPKSEETNISGNFNANVFVSKVYLKALSEHKNGIAKINVESNFVDLDKAEKGGLYDYFAFKGEPAKNQVITGKITKIRFEKYKTGEHYDFINKKTVFEYSYNPVEEFVEDFSMTSDNDGKASYEFKTEEDGYFEVLLTTFDEDKNVSKVLTYVYGNFQNPNYDFLNIKFEKAQDENNEVFYSLNEKVNAYVSNGETKISPVSGGKFLFIESMNGIKKTFVSESPEISTVFSADKLPGFYIAAVYFDGMDMKQVYSTRAHFNKSEKKLDIEMSSDKESYLPGEEVTLKFKVKDVSGKGVSADLNVNAIDEAYYKIAYDNVSDPLNDIYHNSFDGSIFTYVSHINPSNIMFASTEGRGGCFTADTLITMADLSVKKISDIVTGDEILTFKNPYSNDKVPGKVVSTVSHIVDGYYLINDNLEVTGEHVVYSNGKFVEVRSLSVGDDMLGLNGEIIPINSMKKISGTVQVFNFEVQNYHTYFANGYYVHNDKGGGGVRSDFKDSALFTTIKSDSSGNATVKFKLPDNITSWRVSTRAVSLDSLSAGISFDPIVVSKPLFVDFVINRQYSIKDKVEVVIRAFGKELAQGDKIDFEVSSQALGIGEKIKVVGEAFKNAYVSLPEFTKKGEADITYSAKNGNLSDTVKKTFRIVGSRLTKTYSELIPKVSPEYVILPSGESANSIVFSDWKNGFLYNELANLYYSEGERVDQALLRKMSADLMNKYFGENYFVEEDIDGLSYQDDTDGGISLLPYSSSDLELSAKISLLGFEVEKYFSKDALSRYFYKILEDENSGKDRVVYALSGLSGLKEPVLIAVSKMASEKDLSTEQKLFLGLSFAKLGDRENAKKIYDEVFALKDLRDFEIALLANLSAYTGSGNFIEIWNLASTKGISDDLLNMNRIALSVFGLENAKNSEASIEVSYNGKTEKLDFKKPYDIHTFALEKGEKIQVKSVKGDVAMSKVYEKEISENEFVNDKDVVVSRKYFVNDKETKSFKEGDMVRVEISLKLNRDFERNGFVVTDILPSGLYPVTQNLFGLPYLPYGFRTGVIWPFALDFQKVKFYMGYFNEEKNNIQKVSYFARVVTPGKYFAEPVKAESWSDPSISSISKSDFVEISKK